MKPHVTCLMATSVDGRILPRRWRPAGGSGGLFEKVHDEIGCDAWIVGRTTGQEFARGKPYTNSAAAPLPRESHFVSKDASAYGVVLDATGKIGWARADIGGDPIVAVLTKAVSDTHLQGLRDDGVSYIFAGDRTLDLAATLETLNRELNVKRVLLEGGGVANGAFLRAGLIDELALILCPTVDGARGAPCLFDSTDADANVAAPVKVMTLLSSTAMDSGAVLLRYAIENG